MDERELLDVAARVVELARAAGADQAEALLEYSRIFNGRVREGRTDLIKQANRRGLGLRVFVGGRTGFVSSSDLRPESLRELAGRAVALARVAEVDPLAGPPEESPPLPDVAALEIFDPELVDLPTEKKIELALKTEAAARAADKRVTAVEGTGFGNTISTFTLVNSRGRSVQYRATQANLFTRALCQDEGGKQQSGSWGTSRRYLRDMLAPEEVGREAARMAVAMLGPKKISSRQAPVLMHPDIVAGWLQNLTGAFNGDQVFKKASWLADKMGQKIASPLITLIDDGTKPRGTATAPADGEGVPTRRNVLIDKGVVTTFLYDTYTARKAGARSTGSANRGYDSVPGIGVRNLYLETGATPPADMKNAYDALFYMTDQGAFGYNPTTGDYSYQAAGLWLEKGEVVHPVDGITVASNSLAMLQGVVKVGNDLTLEGSINAPHLLIDSMTISGEPPR